MRKVLIVGAHGEIARVATRLFLDTSDVELSLYLRQSRRLKSLESPRVRVIDGDATDAAALLAAMAGMSAQDVVYANLSGTMEAAARSIVTAMKAADLRRLVFISSMGIYGETGEDHGSVLDPYRKSAAVIEASGLDYTVIRPAWLNNRDEVAYGTTHKGEPFKAVSETVSRKSVADLVLKLATTPGMAVGQSLGVHHASRSPT